MWSKFSEIGYLKTKSRQMKICIHVKVVPLSTNLSCYSVVFYIYIYNENNERQCNPKKNIKITIPDLHKALSKWSVYQCTDSKLNLTKPFENFGTNLFQFAQVLEHKFWKQKTTSYMFDRSLRFDIGFAKICLSKFKMMTRINREWKYKLRDVLGTLLNVAFLQKYFIAFSH